MPDAIEDFWPRDILLADPPAPVALLEEQASLLASRTNGQIEGLVKTSVEGGNVYYSLYLKVDALGDYLYKILSIYYPVPRDSHEPFPLHAETTFSNSADEIHDAAGFRDWLRWVLSSREVQATIGNLLRYIRETRRSHRIS